MQEGPLYGFIIQAITAGLATQGITGVAVKQRYQPLAQGTPSGPCVYVHYDNAVRYGYPQRKDVTANGVTTHAEEQEYISTFQFSGTVFNDPELPPSITVSDLLDAVAAALNSDAQRIFLRQNCIAVFRITAIRKTHYKDDRGHFAEDPSFDCEFAHKQVIPSTVPNTDKITATLYPLN